MSQDTITAPLYATPVTSLPATGQAGQFVQLVGSGVFYGWNPVTNSWEAQPRMGAQVVPCCRVTHDATNQSIPNATYTAITFPTEDYDTDGMHDVVTNNTRITIRTPGRYLITGALNIVGGTGGNFRAGRIFKNGVGGTVIGSHDNRPDATTLSLDIVTVALLAAGDYIEFGYYQDSGGAMNVNNSHFEATWIGGAGQTVDERGVPAARLEVGPTQAAQSWPTSTTSVVVYNTVAFDTDGLTTTANRFTCKTPGLYEFSASVIVDGPPASARLNFRLRKNGATFIGEDSLVLNAVSCNPTALIQMAAGDYVELVMSNNSSGTVTLTGSVVGSPNNHFTARMVASGKSVTPKARATRVAALSIAATTLVKVPLDTSFEDNDGIVDTTNGRLVCRTAGAYVVEGRVSFSNANQTGTRIVLIYVNGVDTGIRHEVAADDQGTASTELPAIGTLDLAVGDYVELYAYQTSAANPLALNVNLGRRTSLAMVKIGAPNLAAQSVPSLMPRGSAFPVGPADGDPFMRTDLDGLFEWDSTTGVWKPIGASVDAAILALQPASFWKLDEVTGSFADSAGGVSGTYVSGTRAQKGYRGSRGVNIGTADTAVATFGDNYRFVARAAFTVLCLHYPTAVGTAGRRMVMKGDNARTTGWEMYWATDSTLGVVRCGAGSVASPNALTLNDWNLAVGTYDGNLVGSYLNGLYATAADTGNVTSDTNNLRVNGITGDTNPRGAYGRFDCVAIWNRALSQAELDSIWSAM